MKCGDVMGMFEGSVKSVSSFVASYFPAEQQLATLCIKILVPSLNVIHDDTIISITSNRFHTY